MKSRKALKVIIVVFAVLLFLMIVVSLFLTYYFKPIGSTPGKALRAEYSEKMNIIMTISSIILRILLIQHLPIRLQSLKCLQKPLVLNI